MRLTLPPSVSYIGAGDQKKWISHSQFIHSYATPTLQDCKAKYEQIFKQLGCENTVIECANQPNVQVSSSVQLEFNRKSEAGYKIDLQGKTETFLKVSCVAEPLWPKDTDFSKFTTCYLNKAFVRKSFYQIRQNMSRQKFIFIQNDSHQKVVNSPNKVIEVWFLDPTATQSCELESSSNCHTNNYEDDKKWKWCHTPYLAEYLE